jgi:hypothetical protein
MKTKSIDTPILLWEIAQKKASVLARWLSLYEAVNIIADKAEEKGIDPEHIVYKPKAIHNYIASTENIFFKKILENDYNIEICYSEEEYKDNLKIEII